MNIFEMKNAELVTEFDRFIREHPEFSDKIPNGALVVMLVEGDEGFNKWNIEGAKKQAEKGQPIVYIKVKRLEPIRSRIKDIELPKAVYAGNIIYSYEVEKDFWDWERVETLRQHYGELKSQWMGKAF